MAGPAPQDRLKPRLLQKQMYVRGGPMLPDISEEDVKGTVQNTC